MSVDVIDGYVIEIKMLVSLLHIFVVITLENETLSTTAFMPFDLLHILDYSNIYR